METSASYHHGNLREALVTTALAMARSSGPDEVSLREVARRVGVSHNAAYRHFADRDALLEQVGEIGMRTLTAAMRTEIDALPADGSPTDRARARLRATGRAYVTFAMTEPGLFRTAFGTVKELTAHPDGPDPDAMTASPDDEAGPFQILISCLDDLVEVGYLSPDRRPGRETACWAAVHGFALLHLDGPLRGAADQEREADLETLLDLIDRGLAPRDDDG